MSELPAPGETVEEWYFVVYVKRGSEVVGALPVDRGEAERIDLHGSIVERSSDGQVNTVRPMDTTDERFAALARDRAIKIARQILRECEEPTP